MTEAVKTETVAEVLRQIDKCPDCASNPAATFEGDGKEKVELPVCAKHWEAYGGRLLFDGEKFSLDEVVKDI